MDKINLPDLCSLNILALCPILTINKDRVLEPHSLYRLTQHTDAKFRATLAKKATISLSKNGQFCQCKQIFNSFIYDLIVK